jgi:hypothetical protein
MGVYIGPGLAFPGREPEPVKTLEQALVDLRQQETRQENWHRRYEIVGEFLIQPMLVPLIDKTTVLHRVRYDKNSYHSIVGVQLWHEKHKKRGFWYNLCKGFLPETMSLDVVRSSGLLVCQYYDIAYLDTAETVRDLYNAKLKPTYETEIALVDRT